MINLTSSYFILRRIVPYLVYIICERELLGDRYIKYINKVIMYVTSSLFIIGVYGLLSNIPFEKLFFMNWQYYGLLEWCIFILVYLKYLIHVGYSNVYSLNVVTQSAICGGWLYEIPFFHPLSMFFHDGIIINSQIWSILLLFVLLYKKEFKINRKIVMGFIIYLLSSIYLFYNPICNKSILFLYLEKIIHPLGWGILWLIRIPTLIMLFLLSTGIKGNDGES